MKYSTPTFLALSMLASSAQADPVKIIEREQVVGPNMDSAHSWEKQIIGGEDAKENDFPYFASFKNCGGSLIAPDVVMFAAHCGNVEGQQVLINSHKRGKLSDDTHTRHCDDWLAHGDWNPNYFNKNDIALCKLDSPVQLETAINFEWNSDPDFEVEGELIVMGYGRTGHGEANSETLQHTKIQAYPFATCSDTKYHANFIHESTMCAGLDQGGRDACSGDSGGPLVKRTNQGGTTTDIIVGISSWGVGCGSPMKPSVYTDVRYFKDFIGSTVCEDFDSVADWCRCSDDNSEEWCQDEAPDGNVCKDGEVPFEIEVNTDQWGEETTWGLKERKQGKQKIRNEVEYWVGDSKYVHTVCLKKEMCYRFDIYDTENDAMCYTKPCKSYSYGLQSKPTERYFESSNNFEDHERSKFCINNIGEPVKRWPPKNPNQKNKRKNKNKNNNLRH